MGRMLQDQVAIITGAGGGIGRAMALRFAAEGARIACVDLAEGPVKETAEAVRAAGAEALEAVASVTDPAQVKETVAGVLERWNRIDILVNNAGITRDGLLMRMKDEDWHAVIDVNLNGAFLMSREVIRPMMRARSGRIINISSVIGLMGNAGQCNYGASKAALIGFTKSLAREMAGRNILVNAIAPGFIETAMTAKLGEDARNELLSRIPLARLGQPEDIARAALFLAGELSSYVTGTVVNVSGGMVM